MANIELGDDAVATQPAAGPQADALSAALDDSRIPGLVLVDHMDLPGFAPFKIFNGRVGIEIFFVLSGFLITWLLTKEVAATGGIDVLGFYRRRAARLLPIFYAYLLFGVAYLHLRDRPIPWMAVLSSAAYVINYYQAFTDAATHFLSHCWSLAVEEQFYVLWPFLLLAMTRRGWSPARALVVTIACIWVLRATLMLVFGAPEEYLYRALETRGDQLAVGCLLAVLLRTPEWRTRFERFARVPFMLVILACALLASSAARVGPEYKFVLFYAFEPVLIALLIPVVVLKASERGMPARVLNARPMVLAGQASYGMYLLHPFVLVWALSATIAATGSPRLSGAVAIVVLAIVAHLSYRYFELPVRRRLRGR